METEPKRISSALPPHLQPGAPAKGNTWEHSPLHTFIDETRKEFKDKVSFGRWLKACEGLTLYQLGIISGSVRDSRAKNKGALFFFKVAEARRKSKKY